MTTIKRLLLFWLNVHRQLACCLTVAVQLQGVVPSPGGAARTSDGVVELVALAQATALLAR